MRRKWETDRKYEKEGDRSIMGVKRIKASWN